MKLIKFFSLVLAVSLIPYKLVNASSCSYSEQVEFNNISANIKANYEAVDIIDGKTIDIDGTGEEVDNIVRGLKINILNITDDIYIKLINKTTNTEKIYYYKDSTDGIISFQTKDVSEINDYTVEVYANKYSCVGELFRSFTFQTPRYNSFSNLQSCTENPGFYYCQEFIMADDIDLNTFSTNLDSYKKEEEKKIEEENKTFWEKLKDFYSEHVVIINLMTSVIIVAGVATTVVLVKKRRSRVL